MRLKKHKKRIKRKTGYYWICVTNGGKKRWVIAKWWGGSYQFWDTFGTIREMGSNDKIIKVDENQIKRNGKKKKKVKRRNANISN
ncbi:MAG: hypothetical protein ACOC2U_00135 [bacterium]